VRHADAFVFAIAANILRDRARRLHVRKYEQNIDSADLASLGPQPTGLIDFLDPERVLSARRSLEQTVAALQLLGERTKDIFVLSRLERLKNSQIAEQMGLSVSTVEKHIARALVHLARHAR
jgi:RNA polymerase sigma-70 factor (ECF subfamily)